MLIEKVPVHPGNEPTMVSPRSHATRNRSRQNTHHSLTGLPRNTAERDMSKKSTTTGLKEAITISVTQMFSANDVVNRSAQGTSCFTNPSPRGSPSGKKVSA